MTANHERPGAAPDDLPPEQRRFEMRCCAPVRRTSARPATPVRALGRSWPTRARQLRRYITTSATRSGLYIAAAAAAQEHVLNTLTAATTDHATVAERVPALLEAATLLRREHPNVAKYLSVIQQDVSRHPDISELACYEARFDRLWQSVVNGVESSSGLALGLRAVVEGLLAVGGTHVRDEDIASAAEALQDITRTGLDALPHR